MDPNGSKWLQMAAQLIRGDQISHNLSKLVQIAPNGSKFTEMVPNGYTGFKLLQMAPHVMLGLFRSLKLVQIEEHIGNRWTTVSADT